MVKRSWCCWQRAICLRTPPQPITQSTSLCRVSCHAAAPYSRLLLLQDAYKSQTASTLEIDLYHAEPLLPLSDDAIIDRMLNTVLAPALPGGGASAAAALRVKDASVLRFRKAVTRFSPASHDQLPGISTSLPNLFVAGDCVKQGPGTHGCKGLSQEKAYVTGLQVCGCVWLLRVKRGCRGQLFVSQTQMHRCWPRGAEPEHLPCKPTHTYTSSCVLLCVVLMSTFTCHNRLAMLLPGSLG